MSSNKIKAIVNKNARSSYDDSTIPVEFKTEIGEITRNFHRTFPQYQPTPLVNLKSYAEHLNLRQILVKDESYRFGLKAFKVLGGSYAIGKLICKRLGVDIEKIGFDNLKSKEVKERMGELTFCTASDGNHGRGVAFVATQLGYKAVVYLPRGTVNSRIAAIEQTGAETIVTDLDYDRTVILAKENAMQNNWELIQDTSWSGYTDIPSWIMQGYMTMVDEIFEQTDKVGFRKPTHLFLQAGVGSMAAAVIGGFLNRLAQSYPIIAIVEPTRAACFYDSAVQNDGQPHPAKGDLKTIMAGLSCGVPSTIAWDIIRNFVDMMIACDDCFAADSMRIYARPLGDDSKIISGESGAVGIGLLSALMKDNQYLDIKEYLKLDQDSTVLLLNTEGNTDPENYKKIVNE